MLRKMQKSLQNQASLFFLPARTLIHIDVDQSLVRIPKNPIPDRKDVIFPDEYFKMRSKTYGVHRDFVIPKIDSHFDSYAKKIRDVQLRQRYLPPEIITFRNLRNRTAVDTIEHCRENNEVPVMVIKRDEWSEDAHYVGDKSIAFTILKADNNHCRTYCLDTGAEPIRVVLHRVLEHDWERYAMRVEFHRFIVGRPNPITVPIFPINESSCLGYMAGAQLRFNVRSLDLWTYTDKYPPRLDIDCSQMTIEESIKIGDVEKMLPEGVFLHKKYDHRKHQSVINLIETKVYKARMMMQEKKTKEFEDKKREIELGDAFKKAKKKEKKKK